MGAFATGATNLDISPENVTKVMTEVVEGVVVTGEGHATSVVVVAVSKIISV